MTLSIRPGREADIEACGAICHAAFHAISSAHNFPPDFPSVAAATGLIKMLFSHPEIYSVAAEIDGRIVGSNFLWEQSIVTGVGPITVDPKEQNNQIGRRLMEAVLERARQKAWAGVRLVQAGYHNRSLSLYTKLGFDAREPLSNLQGPALRKTIPGYVVRKAGPQDLERCNSLCRKVHGHDRTGEVRDAIAQRTASVVESDGKLTGYATLIGYFGHAVGETNNDIKALIAAAPGFAGPGILVPTRNAELLRWCLEQGLRVVQPMTLMTHGLYNEPQGGYLPSILY
jgi:predicted N-acetyltransferase YhbS